MNSPRLIPIASLLCINSRDRMTHKEKKGVSMVLQRVILYGLLWLCMGQVVFASTTQDSSLLKSEGPPTFFLTDTTDGLCLAGSTFKRCGLDTLWYVTGKPGDYQLHQRPQSEDDRDKCLTKAKCHVDDSEAKLGSCNHCGSKKWNIVGDSSTGHVLTHDGDQYCVQRPDGNSDVAKVAPCDDGYVFLALQFSTAAELRALNSPSSRLILAALDNDVATAARLLQERVADTSTEVNVNFVDSKDNMFALLAATQQGHEAMVRLLLKEIDIDVNQAVTSRTTEGNPGNGVTPLMEASMKGHDAIVSLLLEHGADVNMLTAEAYGGLSALWLAASAGEAEVVRLLLKEGANPNQARMADGITPLMAAAAGGHADVAHELLEAGAEVNTRDNDGVTAVLNVAESGDLKTLQLLLAAGADVNYMSDNNFSPLIVACAHGHFDVISALIDAGADVNMPHPDGVSPLMYAAANGKRPDAVGLLLASGAEVDKKHAQGGTALIESCTSGNVAIVEVLLAFGANIDVTDGDGVTPLMSAAAAGNVDIVRLLLDKGVAVDTLAHSGGSALMYAAGQGRLEACRVLLEEGGAEAWGVVRATTAYKEQVEAAVAAGEPDVEPHVDGVNALLIAVDGGYEDIVRLLLGQAGMDEDPTLLTPEARAGLHVVDEIGGTALTTAVKGNHSEVASLLLRLGANPNDVYISNEGKEQNLLMNAILKSNTSLALLLIDSSTSVLLQASLEGNEAVVQALVQCLRATAPTGSQLMKMLHMGNDELITPLTAAVAEGHEVITRYLLEVVNDLAISAEEVIKLVNQLDTDGTSVLMAAAAAGNPQVLDLLIDHGAEVNTQNTDGHTALMFAYNGKSQEVALLQHYKQYVLDQDVEGEGAGRQVTGDIAHDGIVHLIEEALQNHTNLIALLLERGADPMLQDNEGRIAADFEVNNIRSST